MKLQCLDWLTINKYLLKRYLEIHMPKQLLQFFGYCHSLALEKVKKMFSAFLIQSLVSLHFYSIFYYPKYKRQTFQKINFLCFLININCIIWFH